MSGAGICRWKLLRATRSLQAHTLIIRRGSCAAWSAALMVGQHGKTRKVGGVGVSRLTRATDPLTFLEY